MSGVKINLDETRDANQFDRAKLVIKDINMDDAMKSDIENQPSQQNGIVDTENDMKNGVHDTIDTPPQGSPISQEGSAGLAINDTTLDEALSEPKELLASPIRVQDRSDKSIGKPAQLTDPKEIAAAIKSAIKSDRSELKSSAMKSVPYVKPPSEVPRHVATPEVSAQTLQQERTYLEEEEMEMMPKTDTERHVFWRTKLQTLKMRFKDVTIPPNINEISWREVRKIFYIQLDRVSIGKNVDSYKLIMIVLFFIVEFVGKKLKLDIAGFTIHSCKSLHRYNRLLIELGEKEYSSFGENWPVEVRLGIMVLVNAIIFVIAKKIFKHTGNDMSEQFFELYNNLGTETVDTGDPEGAGMDQAGPNEAGGGGGIMDMLSGVLGMFGGGGAASNNNAGGLGNIFSMFGNMGGGGGGTAASGATTGAADGESFTSQTNIPPPTFRKKKKKKAAATD